LTGFGTAERDGWIHPLVVEERRLFEDGRSFGVVRFAAVRHMIPSGAVADILTDS
jgi:hypothetical protein